MLQPKKRNKNLIQIHQLRAFLVACDCRTDLNSPICIHSFMALRPTTNRKTAPASLPLMRPQGDAQPGWADHQNKVAFVAITFSPRHTSVEPQTAARPLHPLNRFLQRGSGRANCSAGGQGPGQQLRECCRRHLPARRPGC